MKRLIILTSVLLLVIAGIAIAKTNAQSRHGWGERGWHNHGPLGYVAHELNLNNSQKSQIKSIWQAERPTFSSLVREFADENKEMDAATPQGSLDESKVQAIATRQGATIAKLFVEKEHLKSRIYTTVLTPDQRTKADELQKKWHLRLDRIATKIASGNTTELHN